MNNFDVRINGFAVPINDFSINHGAGGYYVEMECRIFLTNEVYKKILNKDYISLDTYDNVEAELKEIISFILKSLDSKDLDNAQKWTMILSDRLAEDKLNNHELSV